MKKVTVANPKSTKMRNIFLFQYFMPVVLKALSAEPKTLSGLKLFFNNDMECPFYCVDTALWFTSGGGK